MIGISVPTVSSLWKSNKSVLFSQKEEMFGKVLFWGNVGLHSSEECNMHLEPMSSLAITTAVPIVEPVNKNK